MKKLVGLTVIILMFSITINAQQKQGKQRQGQNFTPEQMATLQSKKLALELDLNTSQQKQVFNLMKKNAENRQQNKMAMNKQNGSQLTDEQRFEMQNQRLDNQIQQQTEMKKILSDEQFGKWQTIMNNNRNKQGKKGSPQGRPSKK